MNNISFRANLIHPVQVKKQTGSSYQPYSANFVEFDINDKKDMYALRETSQNWEDSFAEIIYDDAENENLKEQKDKNIHIYALTSQQSDFKNMKPSKILGLVEFNENYHGAGKIELLQTNPEDMAMQRNRPKFREVGRGIIKSLKNLYGEKPIIVRSSDDAMIFYEKNGFKKNNNPPYKNEYIFNA